MRSQEAKSYCESHRNMEQHVIKVATFMGQIKEATTNIKADINVLFDQNREIIRDTNKLNREVSSIKLKLFGIGLVGGAMFEFGITLVKKWI